MKYLRITAVFGIVFLLIFACQKKSSKDTSTLESSSENFAVSEDGVSIHYQVQGQGDINLVFVHGWCTNMSYWEKQIPSFKVYYRVITLDLGGHGKSGKNRSIWTMEAYGKDAAAVITKLDLHQVVLIGHSMGGAVIIETAKIIPDRIIGLIGAETFSDLYMKKYDKGQIDIFLENFRSDFPEAVRKYVLENYFISNPEESFKKKIILDMAGTSPDVAIGSLEELMLYDGAVSLPGIKVPIRSINADAPVIPFKVIRNSYENFSLKFMAYVGHFLMLENPQIFNRLLSDFLGEIIVEFHQKSGKLPFNLTFFMVLRNFLYV